MKQMTFADAEYAGKRKQTRKELFLIEMDQAVPWNGLIKLIEPFYPKGEGGRPAYPLMTMLRVHLMQNWFGSPGVRIVVASPNFPENADRGRKETVRAVLFTGTQIRKHSRNPTLKAVT